jgi:hypothetical protein
MAINQSVSAIRRVFETLRFNQTHRGLQQVVPFRTNKLTLLLKPVFTGGAGRLSKFVVLLNAYPGKKDFDEKRNALKVRETTTPATLRCPACGRAACRACCSCVFGATVFVGIRSSVQ